MLNKIEYSPKALQDLDEIWNYIENKLYNPVAAKNTINGILDKVENLISFPEAGKKLMFENKIDSGYRFISFKNYLVFYRLESNTIFIDRVIYSGRNYTKILFSNS